MKWILRILAGLLAIIVIGVLGLLAWGQRKDAGAFSGSIEINRSPEQVWPWLKEPEKLKAWVGWLVEVRPDADGRGRIWVMEDRNNNNTLMEIQSAALKEDAPRLLVVSSSAKEGFAGTITYTLTPTATGTRLEQRSEFRFSIWLAKVFEPLITMSARKKMIEDLARLKSLAEK
jgi:uncharacterized protein YndB with AHSA1/START domain